MTVPGNLSSPLLATAAAAAAAAPANITKSLRFSSGDSAYLSRTPSSDGNRRTFTFSCWVKRSKLVDCGSEGQELFRTGNGSGLSAMNFAPSDGPCDALSFKADQGGVAAGSATNAQFRDFAAWFHVVYRIDTTQATAADRVRVYVNGAEQTWHTANYPSQNQELKINQSGQPHYIGGLEYFDGYLADIYMIDGSSLEPTSFGAYDSNGVWQATEYSGTFGTNGFHLLDFANESTVGHDSSGNNNDFTAHNISTSAGVGNDVLFDVPVNGTQSNTGAGGEVSGNYPSWDRNNNGGGLTLTNGNLDAANTSGAHNACRATIKFPSTGKWYYEATITTLGGACCIGVENSDRVDPELAQGGTFFILVNSGGSVQKYSQSSVTTMSGMSTPAVNGILQVAYDADADKLWLGLNNNWMGSGSSANGNPSAGSEASISSVSEPFPVVNLSTSALAVNFGQKSFSHTAPTNFKPLCTALFPTPTIADGSDYFDAALYTGNGSTKSITGLEFSPDFVWMKGRSARNHGLFNTVAGVNKGLHSNLSDAEFNDPSTLTAFNSDGFTLSTNATFNANNEAFVAGAWDAGSSTVSNTDGSITSSVRANQTAGFSIVTFTNPSSGAFTVGHGLNAQVGLVFMKHRNRAGDWLTWVSGFSNSEYLVLNSTAAKASASEVWGSSAPGSSTFGGKIGVSAVAGDTDVAYCFAPVAGYSAFGSYTGTGTSDASAPFVHTGFRARWILVKAISSVTYGNWIIHDTARNTYNVSNKGVYANLNNEEDTTYSFDILSNGFKIRSTAFDGHNGSGKTYLYAAFAENPLHGNGGLAR